MKKVKNTNNGKQGGTLVGKAHYDKDGNSLGGIKTIITDDNRPVEVEGGEVIINKMAAKKHWKELSKINQSAGNGVPIHEPHFKRGGNSETAPKKWLDRYTDLKELDKKDLIGKNYKDIISFNLLPSQARMRIKSYYNAVERLKTKKYLRINEKTADKRVVEVTGSILDKLKYIASMRLSSHGIIIAVEDSKMDCGGKMKAGGKIKKTKEIKAKTESEWLSLMRKDNNEHNKNAHEDDVIPFWEWVSEMGAMYGFRPIKDDSGDTIIVRTADNPPNKEEVLEYIKANKDVYADEDGDLDESDEERLAEDVAETFNIDFLDAFEYIDDAKYKRGAVIDAFFKKVPKITESYMDSSDKKRLIAYDFNSGVMLNTDYIKLRERAFSNPIVYDIASVGSTGHPIKRVFIYKTATKEEIQNLFKDIKADILPMKKRGGDVSVKYKDLSNQKPDVVNDSKSSIAEIDIIKLGVSDYTGERKIDGPHTAFEIFKEIWAEGQGNTIENMYALFLNQANKVISYYHLSKGGITGTVIDNEIIGAIALKTLSKGVIIAHNHPSGNSRPSQADEVVTKKLKDALNLFGVNLLDSMILLPNSRGEFTSFTSMNDEDLMKFGGEIEEEEYNPENDLFAQYDTLPKNVKKVLDKYTEIAEEEGFDYEILRKLEAELKPLGYTFEWGLDAEPYDLKKIKLKHGGEVSSTELEKLSIPERIKKLKQHRDKFKRHTIHWQYYNKPILSLEKVKYENGGGLYESQESLMKEIASFLESEFGGKWTYSKNVGSMNSGGFVKFKKRGGEYLPFSTEWKVLNALSEKIESKFEDRVGDILLDNNKIDIQLFNGKYADGGYMEPHKEVKTDLGTVFNELGLEEYEQTIYLRLRNLSDEKMLDEISAISDDYQTEADNYQLKIDDYESEQSDIDSKIDEYNNIKLPAIKEAKKNTLQKKYRDINSKIDLLKIRKEEKETLRDQFYILDADDDYVKEIIQKVDARLQTRENINAGTDLFPEEGNIKEFVKKEKVSKDESSDMSFQILKDMKKTDPSNWTPEMWEMSKKLMSKK